MTWHTCTTMAPLCALLLRPQSHSSMVRRRAPGRLPPAVWASPQSPYKASPNALCVDPQTRHETRQYQYARTALFGEFGEPIRFRGAARQYTFRSDLCSSSF